MKDEEVAQKIRKVMSLVFEAEESDISENSSTDNIGNWDSLRHLNLILALEDEFGISIPDTEVGNMVNYKIVSLVIKETLANV